MPDGRRSGVRAALAAPGVAPLLALATVARLHVGGLALALLLLVEDERGSIASAGAAVAALSIGVGATRPVQGRLIDRCGTRIFVAFALVHVALTGLLLALAASGAATVPTAAAALLLGLSAPSVSVAVRAALTARVAPAGHAAALGADTALQDGAFALGPLLAGAVAGAATPAAAVVVLVAIGCAGAVAIAVCCPLPATRTDARTRTRRSAPATRTDAGARTRRLALALLPLRPIARPLAASTALGVVYGALAVGAVAALLEQGGDELTGPATAAVFAGGVCGDLLIAPRRPDLPLAARLRRRLLALLLAAAALVVVPGEVPLLAALVVVGALLAGASVTVVVDVSARAAAHARAEAFGWAGATLRLGNAIGAATAGVVAEAADGRTALLVATAGAALAWTTTRGARGSPRAARGDDAARGNDTLPTSETKAVFPHARIGVAQLLPSRLPAAHETSPHPRRAVRDARRPPGARRRDR